MLTWTLNEDKKGLSATGKEQSYWICETSRLRVREGRDKPMALFVRREKKVKWFNVAAFPACPTDTVGATSPFGVSLMIPPGEPTTTRHSTRERDEFPDFYADMDNAGTLFLVPGEKPMPPVIVRVVARGPVKSKGPEAINSPARHVQGRD